MGGISIWQLLIVALLVIMLFGRGKISELMADVGKGIKSFKKGLADDGSDADTDKALADNQSDKPIDVTPERTADRKDA